MNKKSTRRSFGRRALAFGIAMFAMVTLTAVGFAAWLISSDSNASGSGAINTEVVSYANVTLKIQNLSSDKKLTMYNTKEDGTYDANTNDTYDIYFAAPEKDNVESSTGLVTYKADSFGKPEQLGFRFIGTIGNTSQIDTLTFALRLPDVIIKAAGYTKNNSGEWTITEEGAKNAFISLPDCAVDTNDKTLPLFKFEGENNEFKLEGSTGPIEFKAADLSGLTTKAKTIGGVTIKANGNDAWFESEVIKFGWGARYNNVNPAATFNKPKFDTTAGVECGQDYTRNQVFCELLKLQAAVNSGDQKGESQLNLSDYYPEGLKTALKNSTDVSVLDDYVKSGDVTTVGNYLGAIQENLTTAMSSQSVKRPTYTLFIKASAK